MATQLWNQEIDKTVDWGGDTSTGGAAVSGQFVQKFIKDTLAKKFGYLNYDREKLKYQVFADEADYLTWAASPDANGNLLLATFDAPAPASIIATPKSSQDVTILSSESGQKIVFNYYIIDSSKNPMAERVNARIVITNGGISQTVTQTYDADLDGYNKKEGENFIGTTKTIEIDEYLKEGTNNISITLTGASTQASTVINFRYTVVTLVISSDFNNAVAFSFDENTLEDVIYDITDPMNKISIPFFCSGQGRKFIEIYVNGQELNQSTLKANRPISHGQEIGATQEVSTSLILYLLERNGKLRNIYNVGKNSVQFRIYIEDTKGQKIYSETLYYDVIISNATSTDESVYILYKQSLNNKDYVFQPEDTIEFSTQQYSSASFEYSAYSSTGKAITLNFKLINSKTGVEIATLTRSVNSGALDKFEYSFMNYGRIEIQITTDDTINGRPLDSMTVFVNVEQAAEQIFVYEDMRLLNLEALNRSNSEPADRVNQWIDPEHANIRPEFKNIYFNDAAGWDGKALVLNNGATIEIPYNMFGAIDRSLGFTFEITFEMVNVQNEEVVMLSFRDPNNRSYIELTASQAEIADGSGSSVNTKFNANTKIKLAFIVNPYDRNFVNTQNGTKVLNANYIVINGILDRAVDSTSEMRWNNPIDPRMIIGDATGKAGIKVYSLRVYNKALDLDTELTNWIAESDNILKNFRKNDVYQPGTSTPNLELISKMIPTCVVYADMNKFNAFTAKKSNLQADLEFYDPTDPNRDFYARGIYMCNQGTSSLAYPIRNMRPYFSKTRDDDTQDADAHYYTEVYLAGEFEHGKTTDESTLGHFYTNKKTTAKTAVYHRLYNKAQALKLQDGDENHAPEQIYFTQDGGETFIPCTVDVDDKIGESQVGEWYVSGYREVRGYGSADSTWKMLCDLRLSGQTLYIQNGETIVKNPYSEIEYKVPTFKKLKGKDALSKNKTYYIIQACWKQYAKSGYTHVWTFKADYAESSMCNNAGVGRLWGDVMKYFSLDNDMPGQTDAQRAVEKIKTPDDQRIDIRTSCDGKPMVMFNCPLQYDDNGNIMLDEQGRRVYGQPVFTGLYNIMTDKSSTPLFGFEDIYTENGGDPIYNASKTECWECLSNSHNFSVGLDNACDSNTDIQKLIEGGKSLMGSRAPLLETYEARWPDAKDSYKKAAAHTFSLETFWRFISFCKPAVKYWIGNLDGYDLNPYTKVEDEDHLRTLWNMPERPQFATGEQKSGNMVYEDANATSMQELLNQISILYYLNKDIDYNNVRKELSGKIIERPIYKAKVPSFDSEYGEFIEDIQYDKAREKTFTAAGLDYGSPIKDSPVEEDYYMEVYLEPGNGSNYKYTDSFGKEWPITVDRDSYERNSKGESYAGKTYMEYFSEKKYDYLNVYRVAAYYIYLIRFAAVDQVVKNSMMTTEDGQHWYFINYDNDTILGVRNDGSMKFHWNINRDTFDYSANSFCFAGFKSVLWNLLECDQDFLDIVKRVDNAMYTSKVLSASIALDMFNNKQQDSWGERMYNINQAYKYLTFYKPGDADKLKFIHGASTQYRSWFIENRFNFYDSLWESGEYMTTKIAFRMHVEGVDNKNPTLPLLNITAARENKFFLANSDGSYRNDERWKKQLAQDETQTWIALSNFTGMSSPFSLYGSNKIKVLDFRPATGVFELQLLLFADGVDWAKTKGCLMTGLLIGTSDEYREKEAFRYTNKTNADAALITTTIDKNNPYSSAIKLDFGTVNVDGIIETEEDGVFVYSTNSNDEITLPLVVVKAGEYVDRGNAVALVAGQTTFTVESLPKTVVPISMIGSLNDIKSLEEIDIRNCFNVAEPLGDLDISKLNNLHIFRAIGSSITTFCPAKGVKLTEVSLPNTHRIETLALNNVTFAQRTDDEGNVIDVPQFNYTPDYALKSLSLNNIIFEDSNNAAFDIVEFVTNWINAYKEQFSGTDSYNLKSLTLELDGVDIIAPVSFLRLVKSINLKSFSGKVYVLGEVDPSEALTQAEYEELAQLYAAERPFESGQKLQFSAADATFWNISGLTRIDAPEGTQFGGNDVEFYYEILHGDTFKFRATRFSSTDKNADKQNYRFEYVNRQEKFVRDGITTVNGELQISTEEYKFSLVTSQSGFSTFKSEVAGKPSRNNIRYIMIYPIDDKGYRIGSDCVYVKVNKIVEPSEILLYLDDDLLTKTTTFVDGVQMPQYEVEFTDHLVEKQFYIKYENESEITVDSVKPSISFGSFTESIFEDNAGNILENSIRVNINNVKAGSEFKFTPKIQPNDNHSVKLFITANFKSGLSDSSDGLRSIKAVLNVKLRAIKPANIEIGLGDYQSNENVFLTSIPNIVWSKPKENDSENFDNIEFKYSVRLSITCPIPSEGMLFPITPYRFEGTTSNRLYDTNIPIKNLVIDGRQDVSGATNQINIPELVKDDDGNWFIKVTPRNKVNAQWNKSYDTQYDIYLSGEFGYSGGNWDLVDKANWSFIYAWQIDSSIIYPNAIKITWEDGTNIVDKPLVISEAISEDSMDVKLIVVPYDTTLTDKVTVPVNFDMSTFKLEACIDADDPEITLDSKFDGTYPTIDDHFGYFKPSLFISVKDVVERGNNPEGYPEVTVTLNKYVGAAGEEAQQTIVYLKPRITVSCNYSDIVTGKTSEINEVIDFVAQQSISSFSSIDECVPYKMTVNGAEVDCPWYFVDNGNNYYQLNESIINTLNAKGKLNTLIGLAKRVQYGWGEGQNNVEFEGNPYNSASQMWKNNPNLTYVKATASSFKTSHYRAICLPLANWHIDDSLMTTKYTVEDNWKGSDWYSAKEKADKFGAWVLERCPLCSTNVTGKGELDDSELQAFPEMRNIMKGAASNTSLIHQFMTAALHQNNVESHTSRLYEFIKTRNTSTNLPSEGTTTEKNADGNATGIVSSVRRGSCWDIAEGVKYFCTGNLPAWSTSSTSVASGFDHLLNSLERDKFINKVCWPKYGVYYAFTSGLLDTWFHFSIYNDAYVCPTSDQKPNLSNLRCYPASIFELENIFNGSQASKGYTTFATVDADGNKHYNSNNTNCSENTMLLGIQELYDFLGASGCRDAIAAANGGKSNIYVDYLYDYIQEVFKNKSGASFGSFYYIAKQSSETYDQNNAIGWYHVDIDGTSQPTFKMYNSSLIQNEAYISGTTSSSIGSSQRLLYIPLIYIE